MEGVTGMMARLRHVPGCSRGGLYGPANIDFRFVYKLRLQLAKSTNHKNIMPISADLLMGNYCEQLVHSFSPSWDSSSRLVNGRRARDRRAGHPWSGHMKAWVTFLCAMVSVDISLTPSLPGTTLTLS